MSDGEDDNIVGVNSVDQAVWKPGKPAAAYALP